MYAGHICYMVSFYLKGSYMFICVTIDILSFRESVRAPIPQTREVLVEEAPQYGTLSVEKVWAQLFKASLAKQALRVISLTVLADSIHVYNILRFFAEKMWVAFALPSM